MDGDLFQARAEYGCECKELQIVQQKKRPFSDGDMFDFKRTFPKPACTRLLVHLMTGSEVITALC
ncbi:hypothetical protein E2C01_016770 [Portunus trituberculatus]|uniref:Uncharacterized protein n=1 Tax=Portunus trituberculatus TaxID=210409 RepID=A0A5B7DQB0_PORTR|nr:hypothetical protein [Portunus trituberculatus]